MNYRKVKRLTIYSVISLTIFIFVMIIAFSEKSIIVHQVRPLVVTNDVKTEITNIIRKKENIIGIQIMTVHFQRNLRLFTFLSVDDDNEELYRIYEQFEDEKITNIPLFNNNQKNNKQILQIINGEFICTPFLDTIGGTIIPSLSRYVNYACDIAIPPYQYGEFKGIITLYLNREPNKEESNTLFLLSRDLAIKLQNTNSQLYDNRDKH